MFHVYVYCIFMYSNNSSIYSKGFASKLNPKSPMASAALRSKAVILLLLIIIYSLFVGVPNIGEGLCGVFVLSVFF